jgi:hypothetical protein
MTLRAKFKVDRIERTLGSAPVTDLEGKTAWKQSEMRTLLLTPVYGNGDPSHENTKFWNATPSGQFQMNTVNLAAVDCLELGQEVYLDITPIVAQENASAA